MKTKGSRRISFEQFLTALAMVADTKKASLETIVTQVGALAPHWQALPRTGPVTVLSTEDTFPDRCAAGSITLFSIHGWTSTLHIKSSSWAVIEGMLPIQWPQKYVRLKYKTAAARGLSEHSYHL